MHTDNTDFDLDNDSFHELNMVLSTAARYIWDEVPSGQFLQWAQQYLPRLAPSLFVDFADQDKPKFAYWIGFSLWNAAPLPANGFKPVPLDKPGRNDFCPCGSGHKFKQCCSPHHIFEVLQTDIYWPVMAKTISKAHINNLIKDHQLPVNAIAGMASYFADLEDHVQIIKMLDPLFAGNASKITHFQSGLLDLLCDTYNQHYKTDKKKTDLLERMCHHKDKVIRAEAWQRIASMQQDKGDNQGALDALAEAMRADPNNPGHSLLELTLLMSSNRIEQAKQRAAFWLRKLSRYESDYPGLIETLRLAQTDPRTALQLSMNATADENSLQRLEHWINNSSQQPLSQYTFEALSNMEFDGYDEFMAEEFSIEDVEDDAGNQTLEEIKSVLHHLQRPGTDQADDLEDGQKGNQKDELADDDPMQHAGMLIPPEDMEKLEFQWYTFSPVDKPFSVHFEAAGGVEAWTSPAEPDWLRFLEDNPQAINNLSILDDLCTLIYCHPHNETPWGPLSKMQPLLDRAALIIEKANIPEQQTLPWIMPENRPTLRLMAHNINLAADRGDEEKSMEIIQRYLQLNPQDNHGYRSMLINHYLKTDQNAQALAQAQDFPDDMLAETRFGQVLALYRLGKQQAAKQALMGANEALPLVGPYLLKNKVSRPQFSEHGISFGGKDQAWIYREEMRESWVNTDGCLEWLKLSLKD